MSKRFAILICGVMARLCEVACPGAEPAAVPGTVIHHQLAATGLYIGSPSLCVLSDGSYLASHDFFGPASGEHQLARGRIYRSADCGATWRHLTDINGFFWTGLFVHRGAVYAMGTDKHHGRLVIRRSADGGLSWTDPVVIAEGQWHTAPVPVVEHAGRLWRAVEDAEGGTKWGERYRARMASVASDGDLLDPAAWTLSAPVARDPSWLDGKFNAWLEGNAVVSPEGGVVDVLRVDKAVLPEFAAILRVSDAGRVLEFDPARGFVEFPGGAKKFSIRKDPKGDGYWTLASVVAEEQRSAGKPAGIRNTLALTHSNDLREWEVRRSLLSHPDVAKHGFQYVDWQFDGEDLIAVCRTAGDDAAGGAHNNHDANYLTFHRWRDFRKSARADNGRD